MNLDVEVFGNAPFAWAWSGALLLIALTMMAVIKWLLVSRLDALARRTRLAINQGLVEVLRGTRLWLLFFPALLIASQPLELPGRAETLLRASAMLALFVQVGLWASRSLMFVLGRARDRAMERDAGAATSLAALSFVGRIVLWSVVLLLALSNLGVDITALVAGLGIGGIAVALAMQSILGDLFASLSIVIDKPFVIGDFVVVDDYMGTVEHVGLKTTRIRSLGGEQIVFCNSDLLNARLRNFKRMRERRIVFEFGVLYQTPADLLEKIPGMVRGIIEQQEHTRFDRAHFVAFGESSYDFEVVYWMQVPDFPVYRDAQQAINLAMVRAFAEHGIAFAYPTRTLFVEDRVRVSVAAEEALA
ncbi:MAG TPA: mechanosensitive ion channel family protein [Xanthomonadaceae bacterium]|nr:mechanosensitive ion channel family protein [Xanthomonadaceae bacterium]